MAALTPAPVAAPVAAASARIDDVNTKVVKVLNSVADWIAMLPNQGLSDLLGAALLEARRKFVDQAPTASPVQETTTSAGQILGTLGAIDAEDDPLTYTVTGNPQFGTVELTADGHYTYTPGTEFSGTDRFTVKIADTDGGRNLLYPRSEQATEVTVEVGAQAATDPFSAFNQHDATLFLNEADAQITIDRQKGKLVGTVTMALQDGTELLWLDDEGRIGSISVADVAARWDGIERAGDVRLGVDYTRDGTEYTVILTGVQATYTGDNQYVFSGALAPDAHDGDGVNSFWDVIGNAYKPSYENFLQDVGLDGRFEALRAGFDPVTLEISNAAVHLDTFGLSDYESELDGADPGMSAAEFFARSAESAQAASTAFSPEVLSRAIAFANGGGRALSAGDPVFLQNAYQPLCKSTNSCDGSFYYLNLSKAPASLVSTTVPLGTNDVTQTVDLSFDLGQSAYGYIYVPSLWDLLSPSKYSVGAMVAVTAGPSVVLNLGNGGDGNLNYGPASLKTPNYSTQGEYGKLEFKADVTAKLDATVDLPAGAPSDPVAASAYFNGGLVLAYNTPGGTWIGDWNYGWDPKFDDFAQGITITPTITPTITGAVRLNTPKSTPLIGAVTIGDVSLVYSNPVTATLALSVDAPPSLTVSSSGSLQYNAGLLTNLTSSLSTKGSYTYNSTSGNLLAK